MTTLDKARLEAAAKAVGTFKGAALYNQIQSAITAYIAPLPAEPVPADVAEMARALREWPGDGQGLRDEAASMLARVAAERDALINGDIAVLPKTRKHAEDLYTVAVAGLKVHGVDPEARATAAEASNANLFRIISDIREASGLGARPMLNDIAGEIGRIVAANTAAEAALAEARKALEKPFAVLFIDGRNEHGAQG